MNWTDEGLLAMHTNLELRYSNEMPLGGYMTHSITLMQHISIVCPYSSSVINEYNVAAHSIKVIIDDCGWSIVSDIRTYIKCWQLDIFIKCVRIMVERTVQLFSKY